LLRSKDKALEMLHYKKIFESQLNKKINIIKNDRDENMKHYLVNYVFKMILSTKLLLLIQHNKMILRNVNQTLKKMMNIMLISLGVP
jgi:hypothetical protein